MARESNSGRRGKATGSGSGKGTRGSKSKSGWVKPDGTPLRPRKGDYFPDKEIESHKKPRSYGKDSFSKNRSDKPAYGDNKRFSEDTETGRDKPAFRDDKNERGSDRKTYSEKSSRYSDYKNRSDKPTYSDRRKSSDEGASSDERPASREERGERKYEKKPFGSKNDSYSDSKGRSEKPAYSDRRRDSDEEGSTREKSAFREDRGERKFEKKPFGAKNERYSSDRSDRPSYGDRRRDSNDDRPSGERSSSREEGGKKRYEKKVYGVNKSAKHIDRDKYLKAPDRSEKKPYTKKRNDRSQRPAAADRPARSNDGPGEMRLNRFIANAGICSRREADELITAGVISVNGEIVTELGTKIGLSDSVKYHDQTLKSEKHIYVLLNKPKDYITTTDDPEERKTVMNLVKDAGKERIVPVGRLDRNTTGLLLLTNDGELTKRLTHPSSNIKKLYQVELDRNLAQGDMLKAAEGIELEDGVVAFDEIQYASPDDKSIVGVELHSGKNRIVRRIFESMGYEVRKLDRTTFAGLTKKDLPRGRWRFLTEMELNMLRMLTGKKK